MTGSGWGPIIPDKQMKALEVLSQAKEHEEMNGGVNPVANGWGSFEVKITYPSEIEMQLTIYVNNNPYLITGTRVGDLIVHEAVAGWDYVVSHVPTLVSFEGAVPDVNATKEQLIEWCKKVQQDLRSDWEVLASLNYKTYVNVVPDVKDRIQKHCLGVKL